MLRPPIYWRAALLQGPWSRGGQGQGARGPLKKNSSGCVTQARLEENAPTPQRVQSLLNLCAPPPMQGGETGPQANGAILEPKRRYSSLHFISLAASSYPSLFFFHA